jgi:hypothetical protein
VRVAFYLTLRVGCSWFVYDLVASRAVRSISLYINTIVLMALEALCYYTVYPPTLITVCTTYVAECDCTKLMGPCVALRS